MDFIRRGKDEDEEKENEVVVVVLVVLLSAKVSDVGDRESCEDDARLRIDRGPVVVAAVGAASGVAVPVVAVPVVAVVVVVVVVAEDDEEGWNMARMGHSQ